MAKNLFDFGDEKFEQTEKVKSNNLKKENPKTSSLEEEAKQIYNKYSNYSKDQLIDEFISTSKQKINDGSLSKNKIAQTADVLSGYLNESQKEFLKSLMEKLDD